MGYQGLLSKVREEMLGSYAGKFLSGAVLAASMAATTRADTALKDTATSNIVLSGATDMYYGAGMAKGDVNGDGFTDFVVGGYNEIGVFYGNSNWNERMNQSVITNTNADVRIVGDIFGGATPNTVGTNEFSLSIADLDGDGKGDILIGNPLEDANGRTDSGIVRVVKGDTYASNTILHLTGTAPSPTICNDTIDNDGDTLTDYSADPQCASLQDNDEGPITDLYVQPNLIVYGADANDRLGSRIRTGDFMGNSSIDFVVAAPNGDGAANANLDAGEVYAFTNRALDGQSIDLASPGSADYAVFGRIGDHLGDLVAIGNVGGSAQADILLGATGGDGALDTLDLAGEVYVIHGGALSGSLDLSQNSANTTLYGDMNNGFADVPLACDINGDGNKDFLVGATGAYGGDGLTRNAGKIVVFYGPITASIIDLATATPNVTIYGVNDVIGFGSTIECGDVNKDKNGSNTLDDLIVNSPWQNGPGGEIEGGRIHVLYGRASWPATFNLTNNPASITVRGSIVGDQFGQVFITGDFDGDGFTDMLGSTPYETSGSNAGKVYLTLSPRLASFQNPPNTDCWTHIAGPPEADVLCHDYVPSMDRLDYYQFDLGNWTTASASECCAPNVAEPEGHVRFPFPTGTGSFGYMWFGVVDDAGVWKEQSRGIGSDGIERNPPTNACDLMNNPCP